MSDTTVLRARRKATASSEAVAKRTGKDGKARRMPERLAVRPADQDDVVEALSRAEEARDASIMDVEQNLDQARAMAKQCQVLTLRINKSKLKKIRSKIAGTAALWREVETMAEERLGNGT